MAFVTVAPILPYFLMEDVEKQGLCVVVCSLSASLISGARYVLVML